MKKTLMFLLAVGMLASFGACHKKHEGKPAHEKKAHHEHHHKHHHEHAGYAMAR